MSHVLQRAKAPKTTNKYDILHVDFHPLPFLLFFFSCRHSIISLKYKKKKSFLSMFFFLFVWYLIRLIRLCYSKYSKCHTILNAWKNLFKIILSFDLFSFRSFIFFCFDFTSDSRHIDRTVFPVSFATIHIDA